jgi:hypothetical protein
MLVGSSEGDMELNYVTVRRLSGTLINLLWSPIQRAVWEFAHHPHRTGRWRQLIDTLQWLQFDWWFAVGDAYLMTDQKRYFHLRNAPKPAIARFLHSIFYAIHLLSH